MFFPFFILGPVWREPKAACGNHTKGSDRKLALGRKKPCVPYLQCVMWYFVAVHSTWQYKPVFELPMRGFAHFALSYFAFAFYLFLLYFVG